MSRLLVPFADQHIEIPSLPAGNIALTVGLKQVNSTFMGQRTLKLFEPLKEDKNNITPLKQGEISNISFTLLK